MCTVVAVYSHIVYITLLYHKKYINITRVHIIGLHFGVVAPSSPAALKNRPDFMRHYIDAPVLHPEPSPSEAHSLAALDQTCTCRDYCHEHPASVWYRDIDIYLPLIKSSLEQHIARSRSRRFLETVVQPGDRSTKPAGTVLPFLPDAAIQYRCSDNFIGTSPITPLAQTILTYPSFLFRRLWIRSLLCLQDPAARLGPDHIRTLREPTEGAPSPRPDQDLRLGAGGALRLPHQGLPGSRCPESQRRRRVR